MRGFGLDPFSALLAASEETPHILTGPGRVFPCGPCVHAIRVAEIVVETRATRHNEAAKRKKPEIRAVELLCKVTPHPRDAGPSGEPTTCTTRPVPDCRRTTSA